MSPVVSGAVLGGLAVALGAFGAHGLKDSLTPDRLEVYEVGVRYQMYHALALLLTGLLLRDAPAAASRTGWLFLAGSLVFSGTLYALALGSPRWLGAVTPVGGLLLIGGWVSLALGTRAG